MGPDWDSSAGIAAAATSLNLTADLTEQLGTQVLDKVSRAVGGKTMGFGLALAVFFPAVTGVMARQLTSTRISIHKSHLRPRPTTEFTCTHLRRYIRSRTQVLATEGMRAILRPRAKMAPEHERP